MATTKKVRDYRRIVRNALIIGASWLVMLFFAELSKPLADVNDALNAVAAPFGGWLGLGALLLELVIVAGISGTLYFGFKKSNNNSQAMLYAAGTIALIVAAGVIGFAWMRAPQWSDLLSVLPIALLVVVAFAVTPRKTVRTEAPRPVAASSNASGPGHSDNTDQPVSPAFAS